MSDEKKNVVRNLYDYREKFRYRDLETGGTKSRLQAVDPGTYIQYLYGSSLVGINCTVSQYKKIVMNLNDFDDPRNTIVTNALNVVSTLKARGNKYITKHKNGDQIIFFLHLADGSYINAVMSINSVDATGTVKITLDDQIKLRGFDTTFTLEQNMVLYNSRGQRIFTARDFLEERRSRASVYAFVYFQPDVQTNNQMDNMIAENRGNDDIAMILPQMLNNNNNNATREEVAQLQADNVAVQNDNLVNATPPLEEAFGTMSTKVLTDANIPNYEFMFNELFEELLDEYGEEVVFEEVQAEILNRINLEILNANQRAENSRNDPFDNPFNDDVNNIGIPPIPVGIIPNPLQALPGYAYARRNYQWALAGSFFAIAVSYGVPLIWGYKDSYAQKTVDFVHDFITNRLRVVREEIPPSIYNINKPLIVKDLEIMFEQYKKEVPESTYMLPVSIITPVSIPTSSPTIMPTPTPSNSMGISTTPLPIRVSESANGASVAPRLTVSVTSIYEETAEINQPLIMQYIEKSLMHSNPTSPKTVGPTQLDHLLGRTTMDGIRYVSDTIVPPIFNSSLPTSTMRPDFNEVNITQDDIDFGPSASMPPTPVATPRIQAPTPFTTPITTPIASPLMEQIPQPIFNTLDVHGGVGTAPWKVNYNSGGYIPKETSLSPSASPTPTPTPTPGSETTEETPTPTISPSISASLSRMPEEVLKQGWLSYIWGGITAPFIWFGNGVGWAGGKLMDGINWLRSLFGDDVVEDLVKDATKEQRKGIASYLFSGAKGAGAYVLDTALGVASSAASYAVKGVSSLVSLLGVAAIAIIGYVFLKK